MSKELILYHGSQKIVEVPKYGVGKTYNDYGQGFYCTENIELAKEWACQVKNDGYVNKYTLSLDDLQVMRLTDGHYHILNWLAILLKNRAFDINSPIGQSAKEYEIEKFSPNTEGVDVMIGYRADDSYFSFARDFVSNTISLRDLNTAMRLGKLGEQVVLLSKKSFSHIRFEGCEVANYKEYYYKRDARDTAARSAYKSTKKDLLQLSNDLFVLDIIREDIENDDPRLKKALS